MGKTTLYILAALLGAGILAWLIFDKMGTEGETDLWAMVPDNAVVIAEVDEAGTAFDRMRESVLWQNMSTVAAVASFSKKYSGLDTTEEKNGLLHELLDGQTMLVSMHVTGNADADLLYYIPLSQDGRRSLREVESDENFKVHTRNFHTLRLYDLEFQGSQLTFLVYQNALVVSASSLLVEDVVRVVTEGRTRDFKADNKSLFDLAGLYQNTTSLYIDYQNLPGLLNVFSKPDLGLDPRSMAETTFLDISQSDGTVGLSGYSVAGEGDFLNVFAGQTPQSPECFDLVPNRTATMRFWGFDDGSKLYQSLAAHATANSTGQLAEWDSLQALAGISAVGLYGQMAGQVALLTVEGIDPVSPGRLLLASLTSPDAVSQNLQLAVDGYNSPDDSLYAEIYGDNLIQELPVAEFPARLFGQDFRGFPQCYYTFLSDYLVLAADLDQLKKFLEDVRNEDVWGKSVERMNFLRQGSGASNWSVIANLPRSLALLQHNSSPSWARFMKENPSVMRGFDMASLQFSHDAGRFYTAVTLKVTANADEKVLAAGFTEGFSTTFDEVLTSPPLLVRNHLDRRFELFVQDEANMLHFVNHDGSKQWAKQLDGPLMSAVHEVQMRKDGKIQYFFVTGDAFHLLDHNGGYLDGFPLTMQEGISLRHGNVIDYANTRDYRFVADDQQGNIYLIDGKGNLLEGWSPRPTDYRLAFAPFHIRVRNRDCILAMQENGILHLLNRRGESYPGFPVSLGSSVHSEVFMSQGASFAASFISVVTDAGDVVKIDLNGKTVSSTQMYRPDKTTTFSLCPDVAGRTFAIIRQTGRQLAVYDRKQKLLLEQGLSSDSEVEGQYYNLGAGRELIVLNDKGLGLSSLYSVGHGLLGGRPFESNGRVALIASEAKGNITLYRTKKSTVGTLIIDTAAP